MKKIILVLMALVSFANCATRTKPAEALSLARQNKAVIIDVREKEEVQAGMIPGAHWFPLSRLNSDPNWQDDLEKITQGKKAFLYCRSGNRSTKASEMMKSKGFEAESIGGYEEIRNQLPRDH